MLAGVGSACKAFLAGAARTSVQGAHIMHSALERPPGQALITVSNHVAAIDDPLITAALVPTEYLFKPEVGRTLSGVARFLAVPFIPLFLSLESPCFYPLSPSCCKVACYMSAGAGGVPYST